MLPLSSSTDVPAIDVDVAIIGGGIQGLWLLADLTDRGYHAVLLERMRPGFGQTGHAHVFLHEGHMYASMLKESDEYSVQRATVVMEANRLWRDALLNGRLASLPQLRNDFYIGWVRPDSAKKFEERCRRANLPCQPSPAPPSAFGDWAKKATLYKSEGICLESKALLDQLLSYGGMRERVSYCKEISLDPYISGKFNLVVKRPSDPAGQISDKSLRILSSALVLSAGTGNERLVSHGLPKAGINMDPIGSRQQTVKTFMLVIRDLKGVLKPVAGMFPSFGGIFIVSRQDDQGRTVLLIADGHRDPILCPGEMTALDAGTWFRRIKIELDRVLNAVGKNAGDYEWGIYEATKAEPWTPSNRYPGGGHLPGSFSKSKHPDVPLWLTWPTLLTFAPTVAGEIVREMEQTVPMGATAPDWNSWADFREDLTPTECRWKTTPLLGWDEFKRCFA